MDVINYKLEKFEGPLDLCLSLIKSNKMSIDDIQISVLCDQYIDYITKAGEMDIELSSEFLLMASELMLIKSRMLLPRQEELEEDPRAELAAALLEYQRAKEAANLLKDYYSVYGNRMVKETDEISVDKSYVRQHDVELLSRAIVRVMTEIRVSDEEAKANFKPLIEKKTVSVSSVVKRIVNRMKTDKKSDLVTIFRTAESKTELVTMFLAMLELFKSGILVMDERTDSGNDSNGVIDVADNVGVSFNENADLAELEAMDDSDYTESAI